MHYYHRTIDELGSTGLVCLEVEISFDIQWPEPEVGFGGQIDVNDVIPLSIEGYDSYTVDFGERPDWRVFAEGAAWRWVEAHKEELTEEMFEELESADEAAAEADWESRREMKRELQRGIA